MPRANHRDVRHRTAHPRELNRLRGAFERLRWEHLGNTAYRYPVLGSQEPTEDWFNHVVPALMLLRAFARYVCADRPEYPTVLDRRAEFDRV